MIFLVGQTHEQENMNGFRSASSLPRTHTHTLHLSDWLFVMIVLRMRVAQTDDVIEGTDEMKAQFMLYGSIKCLAVWQEFIRVFFFFFLSVLCLVKLWWVY